MIFFMSFSQFSTLDLWNNVLISPHMKLWLLPVPKVAQCHGASGMPVVDRVTLSIFWSILLQPGFDSYPEPCLVRPLFCESFLLQSRYAFFPLGSPSPPAITFLTFKHVSFFVAVICSSKFVCPFQWIVDMELRPKLDSLKSIRHSMLFVVRVESIVCYCENLEYGFGIDVRWTLTIAWTCQEFV